MIKNGNLRIVYIVSDFFIVWYIRYYHILLINHIYEIFPWQHGQLSVYKTSNAWNTNIKLLLEGFTWMSSFFLPTASFFQLPFIASFFLHPSPSLCCLPLPTHSSHTHSQSKCVVIRLSQRQASHHCIKTWLPLVGSVWLPSMLLWIPRTLNSAPFISFLCSVSKNN